MKVILNEYGEYVISQEDIDDRFSSGIKQHGFCCGFIDLVKISKTYHAFNCRRCNFRFVFPIKVDTWLKLKQFVKRNKK